MLPIGRRPPASVRSTRARVATCHHGAVRHRRIAGMIGLPWWRFGRRRSRQRRPRRQDPAQTPRWYSPAVPPKSRVRPTGAARSSTRCALESARSRSGCTRSTTPPPPTSPPPSIGIADARTHILATAANCPHTKMVLGGFSQGAAVMGFVTADVVPDGVSVSDVPPPMPPDIADHIAAIALFGKPSPRFMHAINDPSIAIGTEYVSKTIDLCVDNDLVCDPHGTSFAAHNQYTDSGMVDQGAVFVSNLLQAKWAADVPVPSPSTTRPLLTPSAPSPLSAPVGPVGPSGLLAGDAAHPAAHLPSGPITPPGPATPTSLPPPVGPLA